MREAMYNLARPVVCRRSADSYDAEVQVMWLKKQWVVGRGYASHEAAQVAARAVADYLHTSVEAAILVAMQDYKEAKE